MITFTWECPELHEEYTAQRKITFELKDEATLDEMLEAYTDFLKSLGYQVPENSCLLFDQDDVQYTNNVTPLKRGEDE
jgi:hypothetical protein